MTDAITTAADFTRLLEADVQRHLGDANLTLARYATLTRADDTTVVELAHQVGVTAQMVSRTVRDLRLLGYLHQARSQPAGPDRRQRRLQVTEAGRVALTRAAALDLPPTLLAAMETYVAAVTA